MKFKQKMLLALVGTALTAAFSGASAQTVRIANQGDSLSLDPQNPGAWTDRIHHLAKLQDINSTDLSAFNQRGGKLLMAHGTADVLVSTRATAQVVSDTAGVPGRTRPLCEYPTWPRYSGAGDVNQAASFSCVAQ